MRHSYTCSCPTPMAYHQPTSSHRFNERAREEVTLHPAESAAAHLHAPCASLPPRNTFFVRSATSLSTPPLPEQLTLEPWQATVRCVQADASSPVSWACDLKQWGSEGLHLNRTHIRSRSSGITGGPYFQTVPQTLLCGLGVCVSHHHSDAMLLLLPGHSEPPLLSVVFCSDRHRGGSKQAPTLLCTFFSLGSGQDRR
ncbi:hypothetical protein NDU88_006063 [Pleurodeles waltl]|uniref:Uncharacterized protein n=1 Tax=Pleurodeles waltl TaxID=8319 RepID=A0AAV7PMC4_PLEWA|nr:hypothetical protein NDU88_006063 [Pleurodeles waltl]